MLITSPGQFQANAYQAKRRLCLNSEGQVVEEHDPTSTTLLVHEGGYLPRERAQQLGLLDADGNEVEPADLTPAAPAQTQNKSTANKAKTPSATK